MSEGTQMYRERGNTGISMMSDFKRIEDDFEVENVMKFEGNDEAGGKRYTAGNESDFGKTSSPAKNNGNRIS